MDAPVPNTGPRFSILQQQQAKALVQMCGFTIAYTLALALQNYSELAGEEAMEPGKICTKEECLQLANALMQEIPEDWDPEIREPEQPTPPAMPGDPHGD